MFRKTLFPVLIGLAFLACGYLTGRTWPDLLPFGSEATQSPAESELESAKLAVAQGRLLPRGGIVSVFAPQGQIVERYLVENQDGSDLVGASVTHGQELVALVSQQLLRDQVDLANAQSSDADIELNNQVRLAESRVQQAELAVKEAEFRYEQVQSQADTLKIGEKKLQAADQKLRRFKELKADPELASLVSQQQIDDQQILFDEAKLQLEQGQQEFDLALEGAQLALRAARENLELAKTARDEISSAQPESLNATRQLAETQLRSSKINAPIDGTILKVFVQPGESVVNTPLMQLGNLQEMECLVEVSERDITLLRNQRDRVLARIKSPALRDAEDNRIELTGRIIQIGRIVGDASLPTPNPLAMADKKTVDVTVLLDDPTAARQLINMQVDVTFELPGENNN